MAHNLDKHYNDFGGLDVSPSLLVQSAKTVRKGSKNFRWNYNDQLQNREGFQHKTAQSNAAEAGLIEYKFKDINTGESKTEILGVSFDGKLRKRLIDRLKLSVTAASTVYYYSFFYDSTVSNYKIVFYDSSQVVLASSTVPTALTLEALKIIINAFGIAGLSADVVDELGTSIISANLSYLMDVIWLEEFNKTPTFTDIEYNEVWYWEEISTPDGNPAFLDSSVPADAAIQNSQDYEGVFYVNQNNSVYITDGGFPFKYDGKSLYRAGLPKIFQTKTPTANYSGLSVSLQAPDVGNPGYTVGIHSFLFQARYKDRNGVEILGKIQPITDTIYLNPIYSQQRINVTPTSDIGIDVYVPTIVQERKFPNYSFKANLGAPLALVAGANTVIVDSDHNIKAGMALRYSRYLLVTSVTPTTITFTAPASLAGSFIVDNQVITACYCPDEAINELVNAFVNTGNVTPSVYGTFYVMFVSKAGVLNTFYQTYDWFGIPSISAHEYTQGTRHGDSTLLTSLILNQEGDELPRSCRYLNAWQNQIAQAGRPYQPLVANDYYPTIYNSSDVVDLQTKNAFTYTEVHLCDFQSVYWASVLYPEGFPQSGLNEESFESSFNDRITGIFPNKDALFAFKQRTTGYLTGTLATGDIVKEILEVDVGCATQQSIQEVRGSLVFMDENLGFWNVVAGRLPVFMGYQIQTYFKENKIQPRNLFLNFRRAKSVNFRSLDQYICYIPAGKKEDGEDAPISDPTSGSIAFVFDYGDDIGKPKSMWMAFQEINAAGGMLFSADSELIISEKQALNNRLWKQKFTGSIYDYSDHDQPIEFNYKGAFLTMGQPVIDKSFQRVILSSVLGGFSVVINQFANFIDTIVGSYQLTFGTTGRTTVKLDVKANIEKLSGLSFGFYANEINEAIRIDGWEVEYSAPFDPGEPKK